MHRKLKCIKITSAGETMHIRRNFVEDKTTSLLASVILLSLTHTISGEFFDRFCVRPPYKGKGQFQNKNAECAVKYKLVSKHKEQAREICEGNAPYYVNDFEAGFPTKCVYARPLVQCDEEEAGFEENCLTVKGYGPFDKHGEACGKLQLHSLKSETEKKWVSVIFTGKGPEIWTSISDEEGFQIRHMKKRKGREANNSIEETEEIKPIKLRTRTSTEGEYRKGDLLYGDPVEHHPFLCSRRSSYRATGLQILVSNAQQLGFSLTTAKDRNGDDRPFIVFHNVFTVDASKFEANYKSFDHVCDVLIEEDICNAQLRAITKPEKVRSNVKLDTRFVVVHYRKC
ncbi:hypothetical protein GCK32_012238 [Trichostrongylus colubriformis]|uniref:Uncharacterized protein n=1 Tax=Trichostrongylus colubriformis TaxID=6319 RepID=A0AAN8FM95_TRICO